MQREGGQIRSQFSVFSKTESELPLWILLTLILWYLLKPLLSTSVSGNSAPFIFFF